MASSVLVVDDDAGVRRMLARTLEADGARVRAVASGGQALAAIEQEPPDLVILDIAMPGIDGLSVCRRVRSSGLATPILLLTARDRVRDRVEGLDAGADDYLIKPFAPAELAARVRALTRRHGGALLQWEELVLDIAARTVRRGERVIELTRRETELLELLMRNARAVVTRQVAIDEIWSGAAVANVVDRYVGYLRRKLGEPPVIQTVRGVGFSLRSSAAAPR